MIREEKNLGKYQRVILAYLNHMDVATVMRLRQNLGMTARQAGNSVDTLRQRKLVTIRKGSVYITARGREVVAKQRL
jgi:predicted methyltransferase